MVLKDSTKDLYKFFGDLLDYPKTDVLESANNCKILCNEINPEAGSLMEKFCSFIEKNSSEKLEEVYTSTFEMNTSCSSYVGYHLFGETHKRSIFMLELKERYRLFNFTAPDNELPDHLSLILKFLSICPDFDLANEIINEALLPVLNKTKEKATETYKILLDALVLVLNSSINKVKISNN